jgi:galacturan 1,4-alpha-galacturonidase
MVVELSMALVRLGTTACTSPPLNSSLLSPQTCTFSNSASNSSLVRPILFTISSATNATVKNLNLINGPEWLVLINESKNVVFDNVNVNASSTSKNPAKNTDGWDIYRSDSVTIQNAKINNGDDCVSFKPSMSNVLHSSALELTI